MISLVIFFALSTHGVKSAAEVSAMRRQTTLQMGSNGSREELRVGDEVHIELQAIGGAGYWWYFDGFDSDHFDLLREETRVENPARGTVGSPVIGVWILGVRKAGITSIRMKCYRQWEGMEKSVNQFEVQVDILP